jgi:hypothetical protein
LSKNKRKEEENEYEIERISDSTFSKSNDKELSSYSSSINGLENGLIITLDDLLFNDDSLLSSIKRISLAIIIFDIHHEKKKKSVDYFIYIYIYPYVCLFPGNR